MTPTTEQWLGLHKRCLDPLRAVLTDLPEDLLREADREPQRSIGGILCHIIGAEIHWLGQVNIPPRFSRPPEAEWSAASFVRILGEIDDQYAGILADRPNDQDVLFGLSRVCQHALSHLTTLAQLRRMRQPEWRLPAARTPGSWAYAVDYQTNLLLGAEPQRGD